MQDGRRNVLKAFAAIAAVGGSFENRPQRVQASDVPAAENTDRSTVRDRLWIWGQAAGSFNGPEICGKTCTSRMTPAEGAFYLGVRNMIFIVPEPYDQNVGSFDSYAISFRPLKSVVWSIPTFAGGNVHQHDVELVRQLAQKFPNVVGLLMDDFFRNGLDGGRVGALTPKELAYLKTHLSVNARKLDTWVTVYRHDLRHDVSEYLKEVDVMNYWTWVAKDLDNLEEGFAQAEQAAPLARKVLGCYMWDFGTGNPMPISLMQKQCDLGLQWLRKGRIAGMIFLVSAICDMNLEAVEWTRNWVRQVGDEKL